MEEQKTFEEVTGVGNIWQPEKEGDNIEGELTGKEEGMYGEQPILKVKSGEKFALPSLTVLMTKFKNLEVGKYVRVTFIGEVKSQRGTTYKDFKVEVAKE